jgi:DNA modification methylase
MRVETIGDATLYCADCRDVLPTLSGVDAVVTDPPYGVDLDYAGYEDNSEKHPLFVKSWLPLIRAIAPICLVATGMRHLMAYPQPEWLLCWHKPAAMGRCTIGFSNWEPVLLYGKASGKTSVDFFTAPIIPDKSLDGHPCPKPTAWAEHLVEIACKPCSLVIDPFMGSGTTGVACARLGRKFIGIEIHKPYFDIACRRIEQAQRQRDLFVHTAPEPKAETPDMFA